MKAIPQKRTRATAAGWKKLFIESYERCGIISLAAKSAAINVRTVYRELNRSHTFRRQFDDAKEKATDALEAAALLRATQGIEEPVWMKDQNGVPVKVDTFRKYSDTLLIFLLKANRPDKYREVIRQQVTGPDNGPVQQDVRVTVDQEAISVRVQEALVSRRAVDAMIEQGLMLIPERIGEGNGGNGGNGHEEPAS